MKSWLIKRTAVEGTEAERMCNLKCRTVFLPATNQTVMNHVLKFYLLVFANLEIFGFDPYFISFPLVSQNLVWGCQYVFHQTV